MLLSQGWQPKAKGHTAYTWESGSLTTTGTGTNNMQSICSLIASYYQRHRMTATKHSVLKGSGQLTSSLCTPSSFVCSKVTAFTTLRPYIMQGWQAPLTLCLFILTFTCHPSFV